MTPRMRPSGLIATLGRRQALQEISWMQRELGNHIQAPDATGADARLEGWIKRRIAGEPLQYILGSQPFGSLNIITRPPVLIPRPETEEWVAQLSRRFDPLARSGTVSVLDLCTGTGCIPLMLCHIWPRGKVRALGVDVSADAIELAKENVLKNGTGGNEAGFLCGDMFDDHFLASLSEKGKFDIITCNPPYIPSQAYAKLSRSVKEWEDPRALVEGMAVLEFGAGQGPEVMTILGRLFREAELWKDQFGKERAFAGWT
ncbi:S-adenosyl-L-methionine-dependent methyltransferase [Calocera viscosa TUFC12733]|uniref:S-adenosyl-L-methionine-dependent methyltransferase n=1 Tax=Calocera viscosa (strain TUFC12733) TaxID=1330018 RepID=A0A167LC01_CALVF|nr:S-adenosyl-L-methionine-dependent methyltransferase [Calocera viscosa TUFC12733]